MPELATKKTAAQIADVQLLDDGVRQQLHVVVPPGTTLDRISRLHKPIEEILVKLRGCGPCLSGIPLFIHETDPLRTIVRIDLETMKTIGHV